jgi:hypothetical protein
MSQRYELPFTIVFTSVILALTFIVSGAIS